MIIKETNKSDILVLLKSAIVNINMINEITIDANDLFSVTVDIATENVITEILNNSSWPVAVEPSQLVNNDDEKEMRDFCDCDSIVDGEFIIRPHLQKTNRRLIVCGSCGATHDVRPSRGNYDEKI